MNPTPFGRYFLTERLAAGGCAEIFKAKLIGIEGFEKPIVIKKILPHWSANPQFISMLIDEAKIMVRLNHERIVQVYELGKEEETYYIVMEYVEGIDLRNLLQRSKQNRLQIGETLYIIEEILQGLDYIHKQKDKNGNNINIVHRDISPQNILISKEGGIKIADFGIAHASSRSHETATGILKGKFSYMSPEQARGEKVGPQTDLFAVGILFYELLVGKRLFGGRRDLEILERIRHFNSEEFFKDAEIDSRLKPILIRLLHSHLKTRYATAEDLLKDLNLLQKKNGIHPDRSLLVQRLKNVDKISFNEDEKSTDIPILKRDTESLQSKVTTEELISMQERIKTKKSLFQLKYLFPFSIVLLLLSVELFSNFSFNSSKVSEKENLPPITFVSAQQEKSPSLQNLEKSKFPSEIGILSVKAEPWGRISIEGVLSGSEHPVLKSLKYGNYQVSAVYKDSSGNWRKVSKNVSLDKKITSCVASFPQEGEGKINCR